ncbi:MAG: VTT domain-containing protein [Acidobacteria bacterium]|nr:VTT domain-containing protein [Acidobacteriota bacterium]
MNEIFELFTRHGAGLAFGVAFLEQIGAPVPALPVLIIAAAVTASTGGNLWLLALLIIAGALLADLIWFGLGRLYGYRMIALLCRISLSPDSCVRETEELYTRYGLISLLIAKFVPGFSLVAPPLAGALPGIRFSTFLFFDLLGTTLWAGSALLVGYVFRNQIDRVLEVIAEHSRTAGLIAVALLLLFILFKWWQRRGFYRALRMARISVEQLRENLSSGAALVILDVRSAVEQEMDPGRIPGAIVLRPDELETKLASISPHHDLILYCT